MKLNHLFIGKKIREFRKRMNLTQERLAEQVDLSATYICMIETGAKHISLEKIVQIAHVLNVTVDKLLYDTLPDNVTERGTVLTEIISGCNDCELKIIFDTISALKKSLKESINL